MNLELKITGMSCQNCVRHVRETLLAIPGVQSAEVVLEPGSAHIEHDGADLTTLLAVLEEEGYSASPA